MATGGQGFLSQLNEDILSCEICQELFDADSRTPRILPCHHTFCGSCLHQLGQGGHLTCPKCRVSIKVEAAFPTDTTRVQLLDLVKARDKDGQACQGCENGTMAISRCQECEEVLCANCTSAHQTVKFTKSHKLEVLSRAALPPAVQKATTPTKDPELCSQHPDEKLKWFCGKCNKTACSTCVITMHKSCPNVVELSSIVDEKKKKVLALCEKLSGLGKVFRQKAEQSEASTEAVDQRLQEGIEQAEQTFSAIVATAMERQAEVIQELRMAAKADRLSLEGESANFRSLQAAAETSAEKGREVVSLEQAARIVEQECQMEKTAADLEQKTTAIVSPAPTYHVQPEQVNEVKTMIQNIGRKKAAAAVKTASDRPPARSPKPPPVMRCSAPELPPRSSEAAAAVKTPSDRSPEQNPMPPPFVRRSAPRVPPRSSVSDAPAPPTGRSPFSASTLQSDFLFQSPHEMAARMLLNITAQLEPNAIGRHAGISCDGCGCQVAGTRYKCLQCLDYDLCESCEARDMHPSHSMLKLTRPKLTHAVGTLRQRFLALQPPGVAQPGCREAHPSILCDGCETDPVCGVRYKCLQCPNYDLCADCEQSQIHPQHDMLKLVRPMGRAQVKAFMETFRKTHL